MSATASLAADEKLARLTVEARERSWPNVRPVDAATLIILDRSSREPRVLMGKRHAGHRFMPGKFVFPGGRSERGDAHVPLASDLLPPIVRALMARTSRASLIGARRLALSALRETFEETGIVIGAHQAALRGRAPKDGPWADFLATGFLPDLGAIAYLARAITPPKRPKRFDTRFFVVDAARIVHQQAGVIGPDAELTEMAWLTLAETADLPLPAITRVVLADLHAALQQGGPDPANGIPFYFERKRQFLRETIRI